MNRQEMLLPKIEAALSAAVPSESVLYQELLESMRYSLLAGGKRIRPTLVLEFCGLCGGSVEDAMPFACALEMIHTYSLIHDDLPCMDDDDMRRGRPSNHKVYGEDTALLAGDALLTHAFTTMLQPTAVAAVGAEKAAKAAGVLANCAGTHGMIAGQVIDLSIEGKQVPLETLQEMDAKKTGALIVAACEMGCILGGASAEQLTAAKTFAEKIGLAFQIVDDILDVTSTTEVLGKLVGSDATNEKSTYVTLLGLEQAQSIAETLTEEAVQALDCFPDNEIRRDLIDLAYYLAKRKK